jgi:probable HAF family extracellular repeat protein
MAVVVALLVWRQCQPPALYRVTILPPFGDGDTEAAALNDRGQVVGFGVVNGTDHAFLWDHESGMRDLGPVTPEAVLVINNAGQIGGTMPVDANHHQAFLWEPGTGRTMLGTLGTKNSSTVAMNDRGQIVGVSYDSDYATGLLLAFTWDKATGIRELRTPDGRGCHPVRINDEGQILAWWEDVNDSLRWFLLNPDGRLESLDAVPSPSFLYGVNSASCVIGTDESHNSAWYLIFVDERRVLKRLFPVGVDTLAVTRLNDRNQVAFSESAKPRDSWWDSFLDRLGRSRDVSGISVSYLWDPARGRVPLNRYLHDMAWFYVDDLNNNGSIIGTGEMKAGGIRALLLEPIPERWGRGRTAGEVRAYTGAQP